MARRESGTLTTQQNAALFSPGISAVNGVAFSPDGRELVTVSADKTAKVWDANQPSSTPRTFIGHTGAIWCVAYSPDYTHRVATGSEDGRVKIWDARSCQEIRTLSGHTESIAAVVFDSGGKRLATASTDGTAKVWDIDSVQSCSAFWDTRRPSPVSRFAPTACGWPRGAGQDSAGLGRHFGDIRMSSLPSTSVPMGNTWPRRAGIDRQGLGQPIPERSRDSDRPFTGDLERRLQRRWPAAGHRLCDGRAKLWDASSGKELHDFSGHEGKVLSISFSRDGRWLATGGEDGRVIVRDAWLWGKQMHSIPAHAAAVYGIAFSRDGSRLATAGFDKAAKLKLWDVNSEKLVATDPPSRRRVLDEGYIFAIAFMLDGRRLATAGADKKAKLWDAESGKELHTIPPTKAWSSALPSARTASGWPPPAKTGSSRSGTWTPATCIPPVRRAHRLGQSCGLRPGWKHLATVGSDKS